jgi:hypothetical protein
MSLCYELGCNTPEMLASCDLVVVTASRIQAHKLAAQHAQRYKGPAGCLQALQHLQAPACRL